MPHHESARTLARRARPTPRRARPGDPVATVPVPQIKPRDPAARAVRTSLETGLSRIESIQAEARRATPRASIASARPLAGCGSELVAFRGLADPAWIGPLEAEMKWLAGLLGDVRDLDVLTARFHKAAAVEGFDTQELAPLFDHLTARHACALREAAQRLAGRSLSRPDRRPPTSHRASNRE